MSKKILFVASTLSHINNFHIPYIEEFKSMDWEVHVAAEKTGKIYGVSRTIEIPFAKSFFSLKNIAAVLKAWKVIKKENYDVISLHTTLASVIFRLPMFFVRKRPFVFNTVHGYLFNESMGIKKFAYIIPEKLCSFVSDVVMVMNKEDYEICKRRKLYKSKLYYILGMGVDFDRFKPCMEYERQAKKLEMGFSKEDILFVYAAEFSKRKNHDELIKAFAKASKSMKNTYLLLAGSGKTQNKCKELVQVYNCEDNILFLGYVKNMPDIYKICDVVISSSSIEGLPFNIMEAMGYKLPVIASDIKGHRELVQNGHNGYLYELGNIEDLFNKIMKLYNNEEQRNNMGIKSYKICKRFSIDNVKGNIMDIYKKNI